MREHRLERRLDHREEGWLHVVGERHEAAQLCFDLLAARGLRSS